MKEFAESLDLLSKAGVLLLQTHKLTGSLTPLNFRPYGLYGPSSQKLESDFQAFCPIKMSKTQFIPCFFFLCLETSRVNLQDWFV